MIVAFDVGLSFATWEGKSRGDSEANATDEGAHSRFLKNT